MSDHESGWGRPAWSGYGRGDAPAWGEAGYGPESPVRRSQGSDTGATFNQSLYGPSRYGLGPYYERLRKHRRPDGELRKEVQEALFYDTWVDAEAITVEVKDGIVTLSGQLPSYEEVRYATDDAWDVDGVVGVRTELTVAR